MTTKLKDRYKHLRFQQGISLFVVLAVLMLSLIVVSGGLILANLNESIVGNQSDAQRAYGAAEALLDAAQQDIRLNGRYCAASALGQSGINPTVMTTSAAGSKQPTPCILRYPRNMPDYMQLIAGNLMGGSFASDQCAPRGSVHQGVCISSSPASTKFAIAETATDGPTSAEQWATGLVYDNSFISILQRGMDYGGSAVAGSGAGAAVRLALSGGDGDPYGKYWVEIYPYNVMATALTAMPANISVPDGTYPFIFRITAMAKGLRGDTVSVLRTYYIPYPMQAVP